MLITNEYLIKYEYIRKKYLYIKKCKMLIFLIFKKN